MPRTEPRIIEYTSQFKKDFKREKHGVHRDALQKVFPQVVTALAADEPLAPRHRDHALTSNNWD